MELFCWNSSYSRSFRFEKGKYNRWNTAWEACFIFCTRHASSPTQFEDLFVFRKWTVLDHKNSGNGKNPSIKFRILYVIPGNRITILQSVNTTVNTTTSWLRLWDFGHKQWQRENISKRQKFGWLFQIFGELQRSNCEKAPQSTSVNFISSQLVAGCWLNSVSWRGRGLFT